MAEISRRTLLGSGAKAGIAAGVALPIWRGAGGTDVLAKRKRRHRKPRGVHLSFRGDTSSSATATWFTRGLEDPGSVVQYGPIHRGMTRKDIRHERFELRARGSTEQAPGADVLTHVADMPGLEPGQRVRYRVGRPGAWSEVRTFSPAPSRSRFRMAHIGDIGTSQTARRNVAYLRKVRPDLALFAGDLSYANGDQPIWDQWFDLVEPLTCRVPVMAAPGNHEEKDFGGDAYRVRLAHPGDESYYAFDYANIGFVISTGGVFLEDGTIADELVKLEGYLAGLAARRLAGEIDFIAVMQHYPLWTDHETRGPFNPALVLVQEHIFQRYQVDLLLVGHDHFYERSHPMTYGVANDGPARGYVQVIAGGGGQELYEFVPKGSFQSWSAAHARRHHAVIYDVDGRTINAHAVATDFPAGEILDTFTLEARSALTLSAPAPRRREEILADLPGALQEGRRISSAEAAALQPSHSPAFGHRH